jgi:hypothetical protein
MKTRCAVLLGCLLAISIPFVDDAAGYDNYPAQYEISSPADFYEPLAPFGHWVEIEPYGWCWYPAYVANDWRPYTNGYWLWTDGGWYWVSEEPWAWACYHYGRWVWDPYYGWVWVPGTEWAPAWVAWREGGGYIGWAPLPPSCQLPPYRTVFHADYFAVPPSSFVFVPVYRFCQPIRPSIIIINTTIIHRTVNITRIRRVNDCVINDGPRPDRIQTETPRPVPSGSIRDLRPRVPRTPSPDTQPGPQRSPQPVRDIDRDIVVRGNANNNPRRSPAMTPPVVRGAPATQSAPVVSGNGPRPAIVRSASPPAGTPGRMPPVMQLPQAAPPRMAGQQLRAVAAQPPAAVREPQAEHRAERAQLRAEPVAAPAGSQPVVARTELPPQAFSGNGRKIGFVR